MKKTSVLGAVAGLAMMAAGCEAYGPRAMLHQCDPNKTDCGVMVTVTGTGTNCTIQDPGPMRVTKNHKPELVWSLPQGSPYKFGRGGIEITNKKTSPDDEFQDKGPSNDGSSYRIKDKNKVKNPPHPLEYSYKITVVQQNGAAACPPLDPIVVNDGCDLGC